MPQLRGNEPILGLNIMTEVTLSFLHVPNMHSYIEMICLYPLILQNVQVTILLELCML
jgi:hypothetical protein